MTERLVSIVVPTRNGMATLPALLDAVAGQSGGIRCELIAVDSGSTDGTPALLRDRGHRVVDIDPAAFDHGRTRNLGIAQTRGEFVVLMVQDAIPASDSWLAALIAPLAADNTLAGVFARQLPRSDADAVTREYLARWTGGSDRPRVTALAGREELERLPPPARLDRCTFDNVCSCIRRSVWQQHPFRPTPIGEDVEWGRDVLLAGWKLAYAPAAAVIHSHARPPWYELQRTYLLHFQLYGLFGLRTIPTTRALGHAIASSLALHWRHQRNFRSVGLAFAWPIGQYLGALTAVKGWKPFRPRAV